MAALVQTYPQQSGTVTMLQTRSSSSAGMIPVGQPQGGHQFSSSQPQRTGYHGVSNGVAGPTGYRTSSTPVQPYAFTATPSLNPAAPRQQFGNYRTSSSPSVPTMHGFEAGHNPRTRYPTNASMSSLPTSASLNTGAVGSRDDSSLPPPGRRVAPAPRPQSAYMANTSVQLAFPQASPAAAKPSPERYRRPNPRPADSGASQQGQPQNSAPPSGSGMATISHLYNNGRSAPDPGASTARKQVALLNRPNSFYAAMPGTAADDIELHRHQSGEDMKRFRRRSMPTLDSAEFPALLTPHDPRRPEGLAPPKNADRDHIKTARVVAINGAGANAVHARNASSESVVSSRSSGSRPSSATNRNTTAAPIPTGNPAQLATAPDQNSAADHPKLVNIPPRSSSSDAAKRVTNPSPLSKPVTMDSDQGAATQVPAEAPAAAPAAKPKSVSPEPSAAPGGGVESPAVRRLAAINQKGGKLTSKTSRLRRAFSFGSAAELRKAGVTHGANNGSGPSRLHKEPTAEELYDAEQARIAQQQEEAGIGSNIYAGARIFSGSTDNLSISSTASSASIMIRKMGRGMKKGGRSLVGLFRPKSVIGVPPPDVTSADASQAAVSMVTVEAERERVNVNADPREQNGGGTGFPRLERNSVDATKVPSLSERAGSSGTENSSSRKSIVGGERERAEVLAAVRKGILKNTSTTPSPSFELPSVPHMTDSPISSAPSTPNDEAPGHRRAGSVAIGSEDYFVSALRLRQDTKSSPATPQGGAKRNATFSPRIVFYDTWPSQEYDRRGDIATCNRLTPMLAQQIKEELNSFKMEMEVHENSKIYTQFF